MCGDKLAINIILIYYKIAGYIIMIRTIKL